MRTFIRKIRQGAGVIRKIGKGVSNLPDYESYVAHIKIHHPEVAPPTEAEFFNDFLDKKYGASARRCC
ncbi:YbdD/YjiX family protein [Fictibacillus enclensis]|uniref:YbdD/YjiX family protein n=1 Tax=Fictibacillus enclensis TaxID=1017270 RepID=UPI0025A18E53|nr:YbdD/YjiX family protein [Fictibacillus enclensis]MDM5197547.1 YbdD/YjiX family protein [Fictibacillus enclensis]